ncbi:hypothetical protein [Bradyrhizobium sp. USDA 4520]
MGTGNESDAAFHATLARDRPVGPQYVQIQESRAPIREAALESFRRRNAFLDGIFYDIGKVRDDEAIRTAPWLAREGAILIVPPSGGGSLQLCTTVDEFAAAGGRTFAL